MEDNEIMINGLYLEIYRILSHKCDTATEMRNALYDAIKILDKIIELEDNDNV